MSRTAPGLLLRRLQEPRYCLVYGSSSSKTTNLAPPSAYSGRASPVGSNDSAQSVSRRVSRADLDFEQVLKGGDTVKLREEALQYQREAHQLGAALAKAHAKIDFLNDRHRMAQEQFDMQGREMANLTKRNQQLHEQYTRLDIACNHASEELGTAHSQIERLRNECSLLRSDKKVWEVGPELH